MSLNIEGERLRCERINHPNDLYIYFDGGFYVFSKNCGKDLNINWKGDMFTLLCSLKPEENQQRFNEWIREINSL